MVAPHPALAQSNSQNNDGSETRWINAASGRVKVRIYRGKNLTSRPRLVLVIHGDFPDPPPSDQYAFARGFAGNNEDVVAVGLLRPGYTDPDGDRSAGKLGEITGDNYTPAVVDAVATAIRQLKNEVNARAVILFGHSGGASIAANLLGRHPGLADAAVLSACNCDVTAWRARMKTRLPQGGWDKSNPSLLPLDLVAGIAQKTRVRMVVGSADDNTIPLFSQTYAKALAQRGVDVDLTIAPGLDHASMFAEPVRAALRQLIALY
jgi:pimeloyl-ACP methyl ester carboxylesterase